MKHRLPQLHAKRLGLGRVSATSDNSAASSYRSLMTHVLKTRPVVFWSGVWTSIFLVSLVAVGCLLSPSASSNRAASAIASDAEPAVETVPTTHQEGQVPIWMFGAIALTCAVGSLLVAQYLKLSPVIGAKLVKRASRPLKPALSKAPVSQPGYPEPPRELEPFSPTAPPPFPVLPTFVQSPPQPVVLTPAIQNPVQKQPMQARTVYSDLIPWLTGELDQPPYSLANPLDPFATSMDPASQPMVTVVPAHESHPLDRADKRVANPVGTERLRSLQAWLANSHS